MQIKTTHAKRHKYSPEDHLFFDTNIWLHVFGPQGSSHSQRAKSYSQVFKRALKAKSNIYIDVLVISEYLNRSLRLHFNQAGQPGENFKNYRGTPEYAAAAQEVTRGAKSFLKYCTLVESDFPQCGLMQIMDEFAYSATDFNDEILIKLCHRHQFTLITDDGDFLNSGLSVLSCNSVYFSRS